MRWIAFFLPLFVAAAAQAQPLQKADPVATGWSQQKLAQAEAFSRTLNPTGVVVLRDGKMVASWGDVSRTVNVASVRKSLLSALYGIAVADGKVRIDDTLATLGIDDRAPSLTDAEKQATVRHLLMAKSGVYHDAAYETARMRERRPARGAHAPGTFWYYNNWDFNTLGTIYRKATGEDVFQSFGTRIATPIGMEDFKPGQGRYRGADGTDHQAYLFRISARDAARFGQLFLNGGQWSGRQVVPAAWVRESTSTYSQTTTAGIGYGYCWWTLDARVFGPGAFLAAGNGGQFIAVIPAKRIVVSQVVDREDGRKDISRGRFLATLRQILAAAP